MSKLIKLVRAAPEVPNGKTECRIPEEFVNEVLKNGWSISKEVKFENADVKEEAKQEEKPEVKTEIKSEAKTEAKPVSNTSAKGSKK